MYPIAIAVKDLEHLSKEAALVKGKTQASVPSYYPKSHMIVVRLKNNWIRQLLRSTSYNLESQTLLIAVPLQSPKPAKTMSTQKITCQGALLLCR